MNTKILEKSTNLDCLRALAVSFVVIDHMLKFLGHELVFTLEVQRLGRLGVMFFFVHTCTVLMSSMERQFGNSSGFRCWTNFYIRRAFRIYPLSIFAILVVLMFHIPSEKIVGLHTLSTFTPTKAEVIGNLALFQNVFPHPSRHIIGVLWSLPYEVQMYLALPALFLLFARKRRLKLLLLMWALSWGVAYVVHPLQYLCQFLPGVMAYVVALKYTGGKWSAFLFPVFLAALTAIYFLAGPSLFVERFVCLALGLLLPFFATIQTTVFNWFTYHVAKYSYGVYLSHLFCMWFAYNKVAILPGLAFCVLLIVVPVLLFHLIESPMIRVGALLGGSHSAPVREYAMAHAAPNPHS